MPANYLHGVETIETDNSTRAIQTVKTAVIGLVGTAPIGTTNQLILVKNEYDAAQFGKEIPGFTIPQALRAIFDHGAAAVIVINVCDTTKHTKQIESESVTLDAYGRGRTKNAALTELTLTAGEAGESLEIGTDYTVDLLTGDIQAVSGGKLSKVTSVTASYTYVNPSLVKSSDLIGDTDTVTGTATGMKAWARSNTHFGFNPRILIASGYSSQKEISTELIAQAEKLEAIAYIDAPIGATVQDVIEGRGMAGSINFNTSSNRAMLFYPHVKVYNTFTNEEEARPLSAYAAGLRAKVDLDRGYWWSSSNNSILGITGVERYLTAQIDDPNCETNLLNEVGVTTIFNESGTGYLLWGNRTAAFPTVTHIKNFESVRRTGDIIAASLRQSSRQFIDRPINQALIDALVYSGESFLKTLIANGAIVSGKVWYDPSRNTPEELSLGHLLLNYSFTPPPPLERLTYEIEITDEYLVVLKGVE